jgi:hypothetical protein
MLCVGGDFPTSLNAKQLLSSMCFLQYFVYTANIAVITSYYSCIFEGIGYTYVFIFIFLAFIRGLAYYTSAQKRLFHVRQHSGDKQQDLLNHKKLGLTQPCH